MKKFLLLLTICSFCLLPAFAFANGDDGMSDQPDPVGNYAAEYCDQFQGEEARLLCPITIFQLLEKSDTGDDLIVDDPDPVGFDRR